MVKVYGLNELAIMVETVDRHKKAEREVRKQRIADLVAQGIEKDVATAMIDAFITCGC